MEQKSVTQQQMFDDNTHLVYKIYHDRIAKSNEPPYIREELLQVGMLTLWKCCRKFQDDRGNKFSTYACTAIYKAMISYLAREHKHSHRCVSIESVIAVTESGCELCMADTLTDNGDIQEFVETVDCLDRIFEEFNERNRLILSMLLQGYSQSEIARKIGVTKTTISTAVKGIRERLKMMLSGEE